MAELQRSMRSHAIFQYQMSRHYLTLQSVLNFIGRKITSYYTAWCGLLEMNISSNGLELMHAVHIMC